MTELHLVRCRTIRVKQNSYKCTNLKRSLSSSSIKLDTQKLEDSLAFNKAKRNKCIHIATIQVPLERKLACDECKFTSEVNDVNQRSHLLPGSNKRTEERNKKRRSARPLRKLHAIED